MPMPPDEEAQRLCRVRLLRALPATECAALAARCGWRHYRAGQTIIARDSGERDFLFVVEGRAQVIDVTDRGREVVYAEIAAGGHVGELAAIDGGPRSANVVAVTDCLIAALPVAGFRALLLRHAQISLDLLEDVVRMVRVADLRITELSTMGAVERICRELLRRAEPHQGDAPLAVRDLPTQETLAALTGTTRETVGKIIMQLAHAGLVRRRQRSRLLIDLERVRGFAGIEARDPMPWGKHAS